MRRNICRGNNTMYRDCTCRIVNLLTDIMLDEKLSWKSHIEMVVIPFLKVTKSNILYRLMCSQKMCCLYFITLLLFCTINYELLLCGVYPHILGSLQSVVNNLTLLVYVEL